MGFMQRLAHAWNVFRNGSPNKYVDYGPGYTMLPSRQRMYWTSQMSMVASIYNRIAVDVAGIGLQHVRKDEDGKYAETIYSGLQYCLNTEANIDQSGKAFLIDLVVSLLSEGVIAIVPTDFDLDPSRTDSYDVRTLRVARVVNWYPEHVRVRVYNEKIAMQQEIVLPKRLVAVVENPFFVTMNEPNSTLQRLIRKLSILDIVDEQVGAGKLDLIIQLPYQVKSQARQDQANLRRKQIEEQLTSSKYGIAYTDGTEKITQLNRAVENDVFSQVKYLENKLYSELGVSQAVFDGTAEEAAMLNYQNNTLVPVLDAIADAIRRRFITKTARTRGQDVMYIRDPFKLVPTSQIAEIADKFTRNEIMSSNEFRAIVGLKPSNDPNADVLRNKNLNPVSTEPEVPSEPQEEGAHGEA